MPSDGVDAVAGSGAKGFRRFCVLFFPWARESPGSWLSLRGDLVEYLLQRDLSWATVRIGSCLDARISLTSLGGAELEMVKSILEIFAFDGT